MHVIIGAGAVGTTAATMLAERGERVRLITRSGSGPQHPAIERVAADAADADRLIAFTKGADVIYNCANPLYHRWLTDWPPLHRAILTAAQSSGAGLATVSNLYVYGEVSQPITASTPMAATHPKLRLRADLWREVLAAHEAGRVRATEVRGSDYLEAQSIFTFVLARAVLSGKRAYLPCPLDVPHSWTSTTDVARTLITVANDERGWGQAWLVPTNSALTVRELANRYAHVVGAPTPKLSEVPYPVLWTMGVFDKMLRELRTTRYQFVKPFELDSSHTERTFGLTPSELDSILKAIR